MAIRIVDDAHRMPMLREAVAWLERRGIGMELIRSVTINAEAGKPLTLSVVLYVDDEAY